ncbi:hypothetical protein [Williamsia deligens]|uniref:Uncharacterized protein n=1 Tax=Williamsia deligens TaxID=321325 RepID=A0ABW3GA09_9NOCA|nr:hypothetical protein [Williamsia deligens]MCP2196145.1 hypothetical protein [Williamsia deligens]
MNTLDFAAAQSIQNSLEVADVAAPHRVRFNTRALARTTYLFTAAEARAIAAAFTAVADHADRLGP